MKGNKEQTLKKEWVCGCGLYDIAATAMLKYPSCKVEAGRETLEGTGAKSGHTSKVCIILCHSMFSLYML